MTLSTSPALQFTISPQSAYESVMNALRAFHQKLRTAKAQEDSRYLFEQDDFREFVPEATSPRPRRVRAQVIKVFALTVLTHGVLFGIAAAVNIDQAPRPIYTPPPATTYPSPSTTTYVPQLTLPAFNEPELPLPPNGKIQTYTSGAGLAPFEIKSSVGSSYLVKLTDVSTGQPVLTVFVRGGSSVELKVPLGTYVVKYAAGDKWYGYTHFFGPSTGYSKAAETFTFAYEGNRVMGYTITLYKVHNGNLRTESISPNEF
jgi:hypothetical protein